MALMPPSGIPGKAPRVPRRSPRMTRKDGGTFLVCWEENGERSGIDALKKKKSRCGQVMTVWVRTVIMEKRRRFKMAR